MLSKLFFLLILIINLSLKYNCKECLDFQCFDGGQKTRENCFKCQNVSVSVSNQWLKHIDAMINIYKKLRIYKTASDLEMKKRDGMYCCLVSDESKDHTCSITYSGGSKSGIPHIGMGCTEMNFFHSPTCNGKLLGNRCCKYNHCNAPNDTEIKYMTKKAAEFFRLQPEAFEKEKYNYLIIIFVSLICISALVVILFFYLRFCRKQYQSGPSTPSHSRNRPFYTKLLCLLKLFTIIRNYNNRSNGRGQDNLQSSESRPGRIPLDSLDYLSCSGSGAGKPLMTNRTASTEISLVRSVGEGRFGTVWLGKWNGDDVAVKIFSTRDERSWNREKEIYQRNFLRHSNVLGYVATDSRDNGMATELWLVTDYHENGSLYDYLRTHVLNVEQAVKMIRSITNGLAHLHMEINGTEFRPGIAHRDLKSRNILVKSDGECCIGDLGQAVRLNEDYSTLDSNRVGTRRYMAPEVLMDKIVLSDLHYSGGLEAFKKADIYSYSLVLWEILCCCECQSMNIASAPYEMPYQNHVTGDPSIEEMREVVCVKKLRPAINQNWSGLSPLKEIAKCIQESWFEEPDSRLTIMRLKKVMATVWTELCLLRSACPDVSCPPPQCKYLPPYGASTASTDFSPTSLLSNDIPNIAIGAVDNVLVTDPFLPTATARENRFC